MTDKPIHERNADKFIVNHYDRSYYHRDDFQLGFFEAIDFLQYVTCYFSIGAAREIWPEEKPDYKNPGQIYYQAQHFWDKFEECGRSSHGFYMRLDYNNRGLLYTWYKKNVNRSDREKNDE